MGREAFAGEYDENGGEVCGLRGKRVPCTRSTARKEATHTNQRTCILGRGP
jgi:hypothetical protein